jgi:hypothetical protein
VVHLNLATGAAEFAGVGQKSLDKFGPAVAPDAGRSVVEDCRGGVPRQRDAAPLRYQWRSAALAVHRDRKATAWTVLGGQHGTVTTVDLRDPDPVFPGQGLGQRPFHDALQPAEPMAVERQLVVLRDTQGNVKVGLCW